MNKILVTGGSGLVGSQFKGRRYIKYPSDVYDLREQTQVKQMFNNPNLKDIYGIIHTAAKVGGIQANSNYKGEFFYDNIMMNTNIIEYARQYNIKNLVCFLSTCIFPDKVEYPLTEKKIHSGEPHHSNDAYAYAKRMADIQIRAYKEQYDLNYKSVIPTNIYGEGDNFNPNNGHVIPSLIYKCFISRETNQPLEVWGTGKPLREFIYSGDVAKLTLWTLEQYKGKEPLILSTSEEIQIKDIVDIIVQKMNFKGEVRWRKDKPDGQFRKPTHNKIKQLLPNFKFTPIEEGLDKTIEWFEDNYPNIRT